MGETRVDHEHLLEDLRDAYPTLLNHADESLLPKPVNSSFKFRQTGLQFRRCGSGHHERRGHMLPMPQVWL